MKTVKVMHMIEIHPHSYKVEPINHIIKAYIKFFCAYTRGEG